MRIKTSNKLLLGYFGITLIVIATTIVLGSSDELYESNSGNSKANENAEIKSEKMDAFSVLHIAKGLHVNLSSGDEFEILRINYPNDTSVVLIEYKVENDTCYVIQWNRNGMNHAELKTKNLNSVIVESDAKLNMGVFTQDSLSVTLESSHLYTLSNGFNVKELSLQANAGAIAKIHGVSDLKVNAENSKVDVLTSLILIEGALKGNTQIKLNKGASRLNVSKSHDSKLILH
ncbi:MAG: hypothetical protein ACFCUU_04865 [Cyclobacteriaceae bacterium]